jgi:hypothetical protein
MYLYVFFPSFPDGKLGKTAQGDIMPYPSDHCLHPLLPFTSFLTVWVWGRVRWALERHKLQRYDLFSLVLH